MKQVKFNESAGELLRQVREILNLDPKMWKNITLSAWLKDDLVMDVKIYVDGTEKLGREAENWIIWSQEHGAWWAPGHNGYVKERRQAGRYSYLEALAITKGANIGLHDVPNETMVMLDEKEDPFPYTEPNEPD